MPVSLPVAGGLRVASRIDTGLARLIRLIERAAIARGEDLDRPSFMLLHTLVCAGPSRVTTLAAAVHSDPSTVSRQAAHLVGIGLVERRADPGDGRASLLAITDSGIALLEHARQRRDDRTAAIIGSWQPAEREQFADLIDRFTAGYEASWSAGRRTSLPWEAGSSSAASSGEFGEGGSAASSDEGAQGADVLVADGECH